MCMNYENAQKGFSFIELMIVVAIIAVLAGVIIPGGQALLRRVKVNSAKTMLKNYKSQVEFYRSDVGQYPQTLVDLAVRPVNVKGWHQYLDEKDLIDDPWGNSYVYTRTQGQSRPYQLYSWGPQGEGSLEEEWINAWEL